MSVSKVLLDTNIAIYLFRGHVKLASELEHAQLFMSTISRIELLSWKEIEEDERIWLGSFMERCELIRMNRHMEDVAIRIIRDFGMQLSDALVAATAISEGLPLITADTGFRKIDRGLDLILYKP